MLVDPYIKTIIPHTFNDIKIKHASTIIKTKQ